ncbi:hypothetical protein Tco_0194573 [Tanacetum coccineum]
MQEDADKVKMLTIAANEGDVDQDDCTMNRRKSDNDDDVLHIDDETQGVNGEGEELDKEETNKEDKVNELYRDVNVNLEGRDMINYKYASTYNIQVVKLQSDKLRDEAQAENEDFINTLDENMRKIIKKQVKEQVKEQVSKILSKIKKFVNDQLKAKVLTRSYNQAKTSHAKTLYKALVDAYETNKEIPETYGDTVTFKIRRDDEDEDEKPSAGSNQGSKRKRAGKELESTSAPKEKTSKSFGKSKEGSKSHHMSTGNTLAQNEDPCESFNELMDTHIDFSAFVMNQLKVDTLASELLACPTYELMKGSCKSLVELEYFLKEVCRATTDQLDWNNPEGQQYPHDLCKPLPLIPNS